MMGIDALLTSACTIQRRQRSKAPSGGGWATSWEQVDAVLGYVRSMGTSVADDPSQPQGRVSYRVYMRVGADVQQRDRILVDGHELEVIGVREPSAAGYHLEIDAAEWQTEAAP